MTTSDPGRPEPPDLPELPDLPPADEEYVRSLLAGLPAVSVPPDLAERLDAALRDIGRAPAAATTVVPMAGRGAGRAGRPGRTRVLQVAATVLVLAAGTAVYVGLASKPSDRPSADARAAAAAATAATAEPGLTHSGHAYTEATLASDVLALAAGHRLVAGTDSASQGFAASPSVPSPAFSTGTPASAPTAVRSQALTTPQPESGSLFSASSSLVPCLAAVEEGLPAAVQPVALDEGTYQGQPVLVVVLPGYADPKTTYDVFVVGAGCGQASDAHLVFYRLVPRS